MSCLHELNTIAMISSAGVGCLLDDSDLVPDENSDEVFFRRLRPYISGTLTDRFKF